MAKEIFESKSWQDYLCFVENDLGGALQAARTGKEADEWEGEEGPLGCGNSRRCEMEL